MTLIDVRSNSLLFDVLGQSIDFREPYTRKLLKSQIEKQSIFIDLTGCLIPYMTKNWIAIMG